MMEEVIWRGRPTQWMNAGHYAGQILLAAVIWIVAGYLGGWAYWLLTLPAISVLRRFLRTHTLRYELTTQRLKRSRGFLHRRHDELELYRVRDYTVELPFALRVVRRGHLSILTSDRTEPFMKLEGISGAHGVKDQMRDLVERRRAETGTHEFEVG